MKTGLWIVRILIAAVLGFQIILLLTPEANAAVPEARRHPLGNFTTSSYDGLTIAADKVSVEHVEDLAEIPTAQVRAEIDAQGITSWAQERCTSAAKGAELVLNDQAAALAVRDATARFRPGQAGLMTLRVECRLETAAQSPTRVAFRRQDNTVGWREITARGDRMTIVHTDVPAASRSAKLTAYPDELLSSPLDRRAAALELRPGGPALAPDAGTGPGALLPRGADGLTQRFTGLVAGHELTPAFALTALLIATALGALHALAPGHGKTIMAAYAASKGPGARRDVLALGGAVTATHTAGVLTLGLLVASGSHFAPAALYPWLGLASGLLIAATGAVLLRRALANRGGHHHHAPAGTGTRNAVLMGFAGGLVPSPSAVLVLVGAAALEHAWFGVLLVLCYGLGLSLVLVGIGLFVLDRARPWAHRLAHRAHDGLHAHNGHDSDHGNVLVRTRLTPVERAAEIVHRLMHGMGALPVITAGAVLGLGIVLAVRSAFGIF